MRLSIATKVFVAFAAVIVTFLVVLGVSITRMQLTYSEVRDINQVIVPLSLGLSDVQTDLKGFSLVLSEKDPLVLRRTLQVTRIGPSLPSRVKRKIESAADLVGQHNDPDLQNVAARVSKLETEIGEFADEGERFSTWVLDNEGAPIQSRQSDLLDRARKIDEQLTALRNELRVLTDKGLARAKSLERSSLYALGISTAAALLVAILLLALVFWNLRPLSELTEAARRIGGGVYDPIRLRRSGGDEVQLLTEEFNAMVESLKERDEELRQQHDKLIKSERMATVGQMTSVITHELRNPLSSINLNSEMLMDAISGGVDEHNKEEVVSTLDTIIGEVDRLRDITESYLGYSRLPEPKPADVDLVKLIGSLIDFHEWEWAQNFGVTVEFEACETAPIHVDSNQLRQALLNLVKNAVEVSPKDATVTVKLSDEASGWVVEISDHGPGIDAETLTKLFTPFFTTKSGGTGLGLAVTQQIIEEHNGSLHVQTEVGVGTTFRVELPRDAT